LLTRILWAGVFAAAIGVPGLAQRRPVLPQIDLPHPYYFREMYLPQLTSGPSSVAWSPDSKEVVYSMAGSLWRQKIDSFEAQQLTDGAGYDYQPDWSPDGKSVIYVSYQKDAMELWLLDVETGAITQLTHGGGVNVEPRWSPDGKQIAFVSTEYNKRFHIFRADVTGQKLDNVVRLTGETKSSLPRYYYSVYDMEINPVWTRDGKEILFVSNRGHIHGTGGFWKMRAEPGAEAREIHYEETNWKARPDFSPDGSRMVYSSYLGRQWHQLWVMPANGGDAFPISYSWDYGRLNYRHSDQEPRWDETYVRWSPNGKQLAFVSNRSGNTALWIQNTSGGEQKKLRIEGRHYIHPKAHLGLSVIDENGNPTMARISVTDSSGRFWAPQNTWIHADDGFDRNTMKSEAHYFHDVRDSKSVEGIIDVPPGEITVDVLKGFEHPIERRKISLKSDESKELEIRLKPFDWREKEGRHWVSADLHVHMNYGGTYVNEPQNLRNQAEAEGLQIVNNLIVNKEQRIPDIAFRDREVEGDNDVLSVTGQEFHTSYWGHRGLLDMKGDIILPGYAGYPNTAAASLYPMNADVYDMAHAKGALVGAVHPFDEIPNPFANPQQRITDELPVDVALGKIDYMEIVGFSDHKSTAAVWYKLLNLGFRLPVGAGTDATTNYAAPIRGHVGMDRVYAWVPGWPLNIELWFEALKRGRTFATNGPLIEFTMAGQRVGDELKYDTAQETVAFTAKLRSIVPVDHLEVVCNGKVTQSLKLERMRESADVTGTLGLKESGWCLLRASSDKAEYPVLDKYAYATTSPVYVTIGGKPPRSPEDASYFVAWIDRVMESTAKYPDWNSATEKEYVMKKLAEGKAVFVQTADAMRRIEPIRPTESLLRRDDEPCRYVRGHAAGVPGRRNCLLPAPHRCAPCLRVPAHGAAGRANRAWHQPEDDRSNPFRHRWKLS
jgi:TolB protein